MLSLNNLPEGYWTALFDIVFGNDEEKAKAREILAQADQR